jgi:hypothetical protein
MTLQKLFEILEMLSLNREQVHTSIDNGELVANHRAELIITFSAQPSEEIHKFLIKKGFSLIKSDYIYRP